ncbi:MAG: hypothetical protein R3B93_03590 [Bacteroidia bacterium]
MKKLIYISVFFIFGILPGCDFGDLNVDPTRLGDASLNEILPSAIVQSARNILSIGGEGVWHHRSSTLQVWRPSR